jgi:hypothetical protein
LTHNGAILLDHYANPRKVDKLLSLGSLSCLQPKIDPDPKQPHGFEWNERQDGVCVFYGRDRGENEREARTVDLKEIDADDWTEFCYVFTRDGEWKYFEPGQYAEGLRGVESDLDALFERYGVERPFDEYGVFSNEDMAELKAARDKTRQSDETM